MHPFLCILLSVARISLYMTSRWTRAIFRAINLEVDQAPVLHVLCNKYSSFQTFSVNNNNKTPTSNFSVTDNIIMHQNNRLYIYKYIIYHEFSFLYLKKGYSVKKWYIIVLAEEFGIKVKVANLIFGPLVGINGPLIQAYPRCDGLGTFLEYRHRSITNIFLDQIYAGSFFKKFKTHVTLLVWITTTMLKSLII